MKGRSLDYGPSRAPAPKLIPMEVPIRVHYHNRPPWFKMNVFSKCDHKCYLTSGGDFSSSDVVVFHTTYVREMHRRKKLGQIWVFHSLEPPWLHWSKYNNWKLEFNWTMSYRRDSDIVITYGNFKTRNIKQSNLDKEMNELAEKWQNKSNNIAWMVSNCRTAGKRDKYVNIFKKMTPVDVYGKCGDKRCGSSETAGCLKSYKFYLSFENQLCADYITEKSYKLYDSELSSIPITRGGSNYSMHLPPGSYIDTSKFRSISHLNNYINSLSRNITKIMEFMKWRKYYRVYRDIQQHQYCELCRRLHLADSEKYKRLYRDIGEWQRGDKIKRKICKKAHDLI
ncbi:alpha-(1,3)-fucosyltransferase C-like [Pecten maximus]|uniref:alpha-(1,3)-fucosyltransferase C-like n=1 Tax=Pecten maximus TaxID=6579 RepID=UPI0014583B87|nr:alpha-(1,3)-fucosyltransferase C-like [Pecten maximus]